MQTKALPVITCPAEPRARGFAHGEGLRNAVRDKIGRWQAAIGEAYGISADAFLPRFLGETDFRSSILRFTPDLMQEIDGIALGAGVDPGLIYALQLMDEEWWFGRTLADRPSGDGHCSSLAIAPSGGRPTLVGQTMDLPRWHDGAQALLRLEENDGGESVVFTSAGMVGLMGVTSRGLGVCVNTLSQLAVSPHGLPVACVMRGALACADVGDAVAFLRRVGHASGQNYQLGDRHCIATLECSANGVAELDVADGCSLHTNHPLLSKDHRAGDADLAGSASSHGRLRSLREDLRAGAAIDAMTVMTALSARKPGGVVAIEPEDPAPITDAMTIGTLLYEIGNEVAVSVCAGPAGTDTWRRLELRQGPPASGAQRLRA